MAIFGHNQSKHLLLKHKNTVPISDKPKKKEKLDSSDEQGQFDLRKCTSPKALVENVDQWKQLLS